MKISIGLVGLGLISHIHEAAYRRKTDVVIAAVSDSNHSLLVRRGHELGVKNQFPDYRYMLQDQTIDVIDIMTPHHLHTQCVMDVLATGHTVICEKPLATTLPDIDQLIETSKRVRKHIYVKQYLRYSLAYQKAMVLLREGRIGKPYFVQCTFTTNSMHDYTNPHTWKGNIREAGGGVLIDVGVHMLDLLQTMFGTPLTTYAHTAKIQTTLPQKGEDFATAIIEFPNNLMVNINCTENDTGYRFRWEVRLYGIAGVITIVDQGKASKTLQLIQENKVRYEFVEHNWWEEANIRALIDIIDRIRRQEPPAVSLPHARSVLYTILQTYKSAKTGKMMVLSNAKRV